MRSGRAWLAACAVFVVFAAAAVAEPVLGVLSESNAVSGSTIATASSFYRQRVLNDGPLAYWRLGEASGTTATNELGSNHGTYRAGVTLGVAGRTNDNNTAARFDGVDDDVHVGDVFDFAGRAAFSAEWWMQTTTVGEQANRPLIYKQRVDAAVDGWASWIAAANEATTSLQNRVQFERRSGSAADKVTAVTRIEPGSWYHVVLTYDGSTMRIYVNGNLEGSAASVLSLSDHAIPLRFGSFSGTGYTAPARYGGVLDDVALYGSALPAAAVRAHHDAGGYRNLVVSDGAAGYWRLDEATGTTAADQLGVNSGTYRNGAALGAPGRTLDGNTAVTLDGVDDDVLLADVFDHTGTTPFSVEFWTKPSTVGENTWRALVHKEEYLCCGGGRNGWALWLAPGNDPYTPAAVSAERWNGTVQHATAGTTKLAAGAWYHVVQTYDGAAIRLYVNGVLEATRASTLALPDTPHQLIFGSTGSDSRHGVTLDDVAIYSRVLTASQVLGHYNAGGALAAAPVAAYASTVVVDSPHYYFRLGESSGTSAADASGAGRHGTYQQPGVTLGAPGALAGDTNTGITLNGSAGAVSTPTLFTNPNTFSTEIWFKTTTTRGGRLIGFGNLQTGTSTAYDRAIYMTNAGRLNFGVYTGSTFTAVSSPNSYNDGQWHLATATLGAGGMALYIDGQPVASNTTTTTAGTYSGYWRVGYDTLQHMPSAPTSYYFNGSLDEAAVYTTALPASRVLAHYQARG